VVRQLSNLLMLPHGLRNQLGRALLKQETQMRRRDLGAGLAGLIYISADPGSDPGGGGVGASAEFSSERWRS